MTPDEVLTLLIDADILGSLGQMVAVFVGAGMLLSCAVWSVGYCVWFVIAFVQRGG